MSEPKAFAESTHRPTVMALQGMVVTPHYLSSQAAFEILKSGGNAVEAAIAAASVISVVYPHMNSIGGDNFWLIYDAKAKELKALNASGRSGEQVTISYYQSRGYDHIPARGYLAANTVPGALSGWQSAYEYSRFYMQGKYRWKALLKDAIYYAKQGFPVTPSQEYWTQVNVCSSDLEFRALQRFAEFRKIFLKHNGEIYRTGELFIQADLAKSMSLIAEQGAAAFYTGDIAHQMIRDLKQNGGMLTLADFRDHQANWVTPISVPYRDLEAYNFPPNTQGMASLSILNILNHYDVAALGEGTADYYHLLIEATKQAFADRDQWLTDPDFVSIPLDGLLSERHGAQLAAKIQIQQAARSVKPLDPKGDTVWMGVVDAAGNAVSLIQSIYHDFGSGIIPAGTGVMLQNRGSFFSLDPAHVNHLEPRKRTFHTLNPAMLMKNHQPYLVYGTMGGEGQPQTQAALVTRIVDFNFTVQAAIEAPRWLYGRTWGAAVNNLKMEGRVPESVIKQLIDRGHHLQVVEDYTDVMGHAGAIWVNPINHIKHGGADPRGDGIALGY